MKLVAGLPWSGDDVCGVFALGIMTSAFPVHITKFYDNGFGQDTWTVPFDNVIDLIKWIYIDTALYMAQTIFVKLMFLFFFLRIFPGQVSRRIIWCTMIVTVLFGIIMLGIGISFCSPISYYWLQYTGHDTGTCHLSRQSAAYAHATIGIALDIWIIGIPLFHIYKLNVDTTRKVGIAVMFLLGFL